MKLFRMMILVTAAAAGSLVYKARMSFTEPGTAMVPGESATPGSHEGLYASVTGPGSLLSTIREQTNARDAAMKGSSDPNALPKNGDTSQDDQALILAASRGDAAMVEKRLALHSKVDSRDNLRRTPLMYAAWNGYEDICARLLAAGANPEFRDRVDNNVFDYAAGRGQLPELRYLLSRTHTQDTQHYQEYAMLVQAVFAGDAALLPQGNGILASINRINPEGQAPLHIAAGNGSVELIKELIKRGANVNLTNENRQAPLHWAAWNNQSEAIKVLLYYGANAAQTDLAGNTPLIFAAQNGSTEASLALLKNGADKYAANNTGKTASLTAQDDGFRDLAQALK